MVAARVEGTGPIARPVALSVRKGIDSGATQRTAQCGDPVC